MDSQLPQINVTVSLLEVSTSWCQKLKYSKFTINFASIVDRKQIHVVNVTLYNRMEEKLILSSDSKSKLQKD